MEKVKWFHFLQLHFKLLLCYRSEWRRSHEIGHFNTWLLLKCVYQSHNQHIIYTRHWLPIRTPIDRPLHRRNKTHTHTHTRKEQQIIDSWMDEFSSNRVSVNQHQSTLLQKETGQKWAIKVRKSFTFEITSDACKQRSLFHNSFSCTIS